MEGFSALAMGKNLSIGRKNLAQIKVEPFFLVFCQSIDTPPDATIEASGRRI
jgi:hypothetical protein